MTVPVATYAFLPWLRRGIGAEIARVDGTPGTDPRTAVPIGVRFNADDARAGSVDLALYGPGEITGLDVRAIIRTWPLPGVMDAEPNYFPLLEFNQADLPWRYTPARATSKDRLTPWLTLIVLADDEIDELNPPGTGLGIVKVKDAAVLPKSGQLWAWAHVQASGETSVDEAEAARLLATDPRRLVARLLSPRRLRPRVAYTGLLVPTYQRGVLAGLGQTPPDTLDALAFAWGDAPAGPLTLPVYYQWRFGTGVAGDFEALARLLQPFEAPPGLGVRDMDVSAASPGFPPANPGPLGLRGMLLGLATPDTAWEPTARLQWIAALKQLLNLPADRLLTPGTPRTVTPPLYGRWYAATDRCQADVPGARPYWFQGLSVDPRLRTGAGLGTQVVQANQEALMASAWEQYERVRQLNEELRQAQLARELALRAHTRILAGADATTLALTAPVHARVKASPTTVRAVLAESTIPRGALDGAFRRVARPLGPAGRRQTRAGRGAYDHVLARLAQDDVSAAPPPATPAELPTPETTGAGLDPNGTAGREAAARRRRAKWLRALGWLLLLVALILLVLGLWPVALVAAAAGAAGLIAAARDTAAAGELDRRAGVRTGTLSPDAVRGTAPAAGFTPTASPPAGAPATLPGGGASNAAPAIAFREALARVFDRIAPPAEPVGVLTTVDLSSIRTTLAARLDPRVTIAAAYRGRFQLDAGVQWEPDDPIEPIMAAPEFPQPMYEPLAKLSPDWLLPGYDQIPANSATLLKTNQRMIEAYLVGLNHEMGRELLWREYPTDQRGSYFRQFWDTAGFVPAPGETIDPETLKDITPIHTWPKPTELGTHSPRPPAPGGDYLVLFIRGDLLRRYPNTVVYAARAKWNGTVRDIDDPAPDATAAGVAERQRWPLFSGALPPDGTFFGFRLTVPEARGKPDPADNEPGWFFVLQEHSSEPRFGLDEGEPSEVGRPVVASWNNLSWSHLAADATGYDAFVTIDLDADLPNTTSVTDAAAKAWHADKGLGQTGARASDLAYITFQRPMRVGIHASDMIPP